MKNKSFNKHYIKRNPATGECQVDDNDNPVLGELAKADCRLTDQHVKTLNAGWKMAGVYYSEVKKDDAGDDNNDSAGTSELDVVKEEYKKVVGNIPPTKAKDLEWLKNKIKETKGE